MRGNYDLLYQNLIRKYEVALHDLGSSVQFKKRENTHEGVLLLIKLQA